MVIGQKTLLEEEKKRSRSDFGSQQPIKKHSSTRSNILKFHKNIPMSNHDLLEWCKYLKIPINNVLSRDQKESHNHKQAFIYNLEPSYMSGSHWVAKYVKDNVVNYFDSSGIPPFQELVNHAKRQKPDFIASK